MENKFKNKYRFNYIIKKDYNIYKSSFNLIYLQIFKLLSSNNLLRQMIDSLLNYINSNKIMIKENKTNLKLIFPQKDILNIELIIIKKSSLSKEIIDKLIKDIKNLKEENKKLELRIKNLEKYG